MIDVVQRLRELASYANFSRTAGASLMKESASEIERLRLALDNLLRSVKVCPGCAPEAECYVFSMVALAEAGNALHPPEQ